MRTHHRLTTFVFGAAILAMFLALAIPSHAAAAPRHNHGLTIQSTPDPITAGQGVLIYGQLKGPNNADRRVWLFHRINPATRFTPVSVTRTNAAGFYEFVRADGVVVRTATGSSVGPDNTHSRTIHELGLRDRDAEREHARRPPPLRLSTFSGTVFPAHTVTSACCCSSRTARPVTAGRRSRPATPPTRPASRSPTGSGRPAATRCAPSSPATRATSRASRTRITLTVQQQQNPSFTINGSAAGHHQRPDGDDHRHAVRGRLDHHRPAERPRDAVRQAGHGGGFKALESTMTDSSGNYSFTQMPLHNTVYRRADGKRQERARPPPCTSAFRTSSRRR